MVDLALERVQNSSGLYQMHGVLADVFERDEEGRFRFQPEVPLQWAPSQACTLSLRYEVPGASAPAGARVRRWTFDDVLSNEHALQSPPRFLHPVLQQGGQTWEVSEDIDAMWTTRVLMQSVRDKAKNACTRWREKSMSGTCDAHFFFGKAAELLGSRCRSEGRPVGPRAFRRVIVRRSRYEASRRVAVHCLSDFGFWGRIC